MPPLRELQFGLPYPSREDDPFENKTNAYAFALSRPYALENRDFSRKGTCNKCLANAQQLGALSRHCELLG